MNNITRFDHGSSQSQGASLRSFFRKIWRVALVIALLMASQAHALMNRAKLPESVITWFTPHVGLTSYASDSEQKRNAQEKKAEKAKKKCSWPTEKEWNRCERVKTMPGQPSSCDHLRPKC